MSDEMMMLYKGQWVPAVPMPFWPGWMPARLYYWLYRRKQRRVAEAYLAGRARSEETDV